MERNSRSIEDLLGPPKRGRGRKPGEGGKPPTPTRDRLNDAQARWHEIKTAEREGKLVPAVDVERTWASILVEVRTAMLVLPARVTPLLGLKPEQTAILDREIREALTALGGGSEGPVDKPDPQNGAHEPPGETTPRSRADRRGRK